MNIRVAGIDHQKAALGERELFAFTSSGLKNALKKVKEEYQPDGCVLISTCNRTDLWISGVPEDCDLKKMLCDVKGLSYEEYGNLFYEYENMTAVSYLLELSCGLHSLIWGEDQILTQVKNAIATAQESKCADNILSKLFQIAVTAAKRVKTEIRLTHANKSLSTEAVTVLRQELGSLKGVPCLVIGNGEMGRLAAADLLREGCDVTMTVRSYKKGPALIPCGCKTVNYDHRFLLALQAKVIISATLSPHFTINYEDAQKLQEQGEKRIYIDLAVPRDIDLRAAHLPGVSLFDVDSLGGRSNQQQINDEAIKLAQIILKRHEEKFLQWYRFKDLISLVNDISDKASYDVYKKVWQTIRTSNLTSGEKAALAKELTLSTKKVVNSLLFILRDNLPMQEWPACYQNLQNEYVWGRDKHLPHSR